MPWPSRRFTTGIRRSWIAVSSTFALFYLLVTLVPLDDWYAKLLSGNWEYGDQGTLIVLSSDSLPDGLPGYTSYLRSVYAVRAWRSGHFTRIIVSGGHLPGGGPSLASIVARFLVGAGIPPDVISLEERSTSTHENAQFTAALLRDIPGNKTLLTSDQHMFRARRAFSRQGVKVSPMPIPDTLKRSSNLLERFPLAVSLSIESVKIVYYFARGWI